MEIINPGPEDFHVHSINFSDGMDSVDELVKFAGEIGLRKIAITDHSEAVNDFFKWGRKTHRSLTRRWKNIHNSTEVIFGVEGDLLNEDGDICDHIQEETSDFLILSAHKGIYSGDPTKITEAYLKAIKRHKDKIVFLGHLCKKDFSRHLDIEKLIRAANKYQIPMEFNCANFMNEKTDMGNLRKMLAGADRIYVNSDAHTLNELKDLRPEGLKYLRDNGFL